VPAPQCRAGGRGLGRTYAVAACGVLLLAGCASLPPTTAGAPWLQHRAQLQAIDSYTLSGKIAVASAGQGFNAGIDWTTQGSTDNVVLRSPLGSAISSLGFDGQQLQLSTGDGKWSGDEAAARITNQLGFVPPVASLRYWLLGSPDPSGPAQETVDDAQRLTGLAQFGWQLAYTDYVQWQGQWLPRRITAQRDAVRLRLLISRWQIP
jgi:outer membrane lipoprotein LolB